MSILYVSMCVVGVVIGDAGCNGRRTNTDVTKTPATMEYSKGLRELRNRNEVPFYEQSPGRGYFKFPKEYDWDEADRVKALIEELASSSVEAWPFLLDHLEDVEYCLTIETDQSGYNATVGRICKEIVVGTLNVGYVKELLLDMDGYYAMEWPELIPRTGLASWCHENCADGSKVCRAQIRICEWAIKRLGEMNIDASDREMSLKGIRENLTELKRTGQPMRIARLFGEGHHPFSRESAELIEREREQMRRNAEEKK